MNFLGKAGHRGDRLLCRMHGKPQSKLSKDLQPGLLQVLENPFGVDAGHHHATG
jgi:hypothetical protein